MNCGHAREEIMGGEVIDFRITGIGKTIKLIITEYNQSIYKNAPLHSPQEGWALLQQTMDELWDDIKKNDKGQEEMMKDAARIGAMAMRFMVELGLVERGRNRPVG